MALNAQEMKWSNPIKLKGGANFPKVLGENSNGIFLMRYRNRFYTKSIFLERYNSDLNLDLSLYVDLKNAQILKVQMTPKGILVIKSKKNVLSSDTTGSLRPPGPCREPCCCLTANNNVRPVDI